MRPSSLLWVCVRLWLQVGSRRLALGQDTRCSGPIQPGPLTGPALFLFSLQRPQSPLAFPPEPPPALETCLLRGQSGWSLPFRADRGYKGKSTLRGNSLAVQGLELCASSAEGTGSIPGRGTKIPCKLQGQKKKKNNPKPPPQRGLTQARHIKGLTRLDSLIPHQCQVGTAFIPILQIKKLRPGEVE